MDLRHLRYFIAVAEEGSMTVAAEKRLHTAQPSLSRQMRDLELELGCDLMTRDTKGIALTSAGRVFLDHARGILLQVEAAKEATRRAAVPAKPSFVIGFLTGYEFDWLPAVMRIMRDALPDTETVILSLSSPELADGLMRGRIDLAFMRRERNTSGVVFTRLIDEPLIVLMPAGHRLATRDAIDPQDLVANRWSAFRTTNPRRSGPSPTPMRHGSASISRRITSSTISRWRCRWSPRPGALR
jgi:LysR family hca operon transcriptional activator